jgi:hypothetical protein
VNLTPKPIVLLRWGAAFYTIAVALAFGGAVAADLLSDGVVMLSARASPEPADAGTLTLLLSWCACAAWTGWQGMDSAAAEGSGQ